MLYSVIFIDDEDIIRENIRYMADYEEYGFKITGVFKNFYDAENFMQKNNVDLVMADIVVGDESGLDFAEKCVDKYPDTVVVIISAYKEFEYAKRAIDCNVFSYLTKPTSCEELNSVLKKAAGKIEKMYKFKSDAVNVGNIELTEAVVLYINEHFLEDISRDSVAEFMNMTPSYFSKWFKNEFGKSFIVYLNDVKMDYAMKLLRETDMKVSDICLNCNYFTMHYFLRKFREKTNLSPTEYRNKFRETGEEA